MLGLVNNYLELGIILFAALLFVVISVAARRGFRPTLRPLSAYTTLDDQIGQAVESGGRMHISLGPNSIIDKDTLVAIAALSVLDQVSERSVISDRGPLATMSDPTTLPVASDTVRRAYGREDLLEKFDTQSARLLTLDAVSLAGATTSNIHDDKVQGNIVIGSFGPEVALIAEAGHRINIPQTIGSDRLAAQAAAYAMAQHPLIGEEIFVSRAYLTDEVTAIGGLATQDVLRWVLIGLILFGAVMQSLGLLAQ